MSLPDMPGLPRDDDGPVFAEPWQAQAFAMTVRLHEQGLFSWPEWTEMFGRQLRSAGLDDDPNNYYWHWLAALETIVEAKGAMSRNERLQRIDAWDRAAHATPHGEPIILGAEDSHADR